MKKTFVHYTLINDFTKPWLKSEIACSVHPPAPTDSDIKGESDAATVELFRWAKIPAA